MLVYVKMCAKVDVAEPKQSITSSSEKKHPIVYINPLCIFFSLFFLDLFLLIIEIL